MSEQPPQPPQPPAQQPYAQQMTPPGPRRRKGLPGWAIALIIVVALIVPIALATSILLPSLSRARMLARRASSQANLKLIGSACRLYGVEHQDADGVEQFPPTLQPLIDRDIITEKTLLYPGLESGRASDYFYYPQGHHQKPGGALLACEYGDCNKEGRNVLQINGAVIWMEEPEFQASLARPENVEFAIALRKAETGQ